MLPAAITLRNYRAFVGEHQLEIRPLTMLYGDNNVGKSALLRALPLLADSVAAEATGALRIESEATYESGFHDVLWKGRVHEDEDPDLGVGFVWPEPCRVRSVDYTVERRGKWLHLLMTTRCRIRVSGADDELDLDWVPPRQSDQDASGLRYDYRRAGSAAAERGIFEFRGLVPEQFPDSLEDPLRDLQEQLKAFRGQVQWLQAKRSAPGRRLSIPSGPMTTMSPDGHDATQLLYSTQSGLRAEVSRWYEEAIGRELHLVEAPPDEFRTVLRNTRRSQAFEVDMLDSGQGAVQVLPVLVGLASIADKSLRGPRILAVEEPESHMHGDLQLRLADLICRTVASAGGQGRVVVETHSQELLLGIQLALLHGVLSPDDVVIYWLRQDEDGTSHAERVTLDDEAYLQGPWPDPFVHAREAARKVIFARERK